MDLQHFYLAEVGLFVAGILVALFFYLVLVQPLQRRGLEREMRERKDEFIALGSHYLLTPISILQSAVIRLQEQGANLSNDERTKLYDILTMAEQRLWIIAEQLFVISDIERGELRLDISVNNIYETVSNAVAAIDPFARNKNIRVEMQGEIKVVEARYDPRRMKQALIAVLDNAIKFSPEESAVKVQISDQHNLFTILVQDQGIGMGGDVLAHLGEKFYRSNLIYDFDYEGMGLGLHLAVAILRLHGGKITFQSQEKQGTEVVIEFPAL